MAQVEEIARLVNGGLVTGLPAFMIGRLESPDCQNIDPSDPFGASTRPGSSQYGVSGASVASGFRGVGIFPWSRNAGTTFIFAALGTSIFSVDSGSWFSVKTGMATDSIMQGAALNNVAVIVASGFAPQVSSAGSTLAALGTGASGASLFLPSLAKFVTIYSAKCFLAGDTANPSRISFSKSNDPENWTSANNSGEIDVNKDDGDTIQGIQGTKRALYTFKRKNTYVVTGDSPFNFRVDPLAAYGLISVYGYASDGQGCFFASDDGIYYAIGLNVARISDSVKSTYDGISDKSTIAMEVRGEKLFVFYKASGSENNQALVLAFKRVMVDGGVRGVWSLYTTQPYQVAKTGRDATLYALTNASTAQIWKLDTGSSGDVSAYWNTPDLDFEDPFTMKSLMRYFVNMKPDTATTTLTVRAYADGASVGSDFTLTFGTSGSYVIQQAAGQSRGRIIGRYLRLRFSWSGQKTLYGFRIFADTRADDMPRR